MIGGEGWGRGRICPSSHRYYLLSLFSYSVCFLQKCTMYFTFSIAQELIAVYGLKRSLFVICHPWHGYLITVFWVFFSLLSCHMEIAGQQLRSIMNHLMQLCDGTISLFPWSLSMLLVFPQSLLFHRSSRPSNPIWMGKIGNCGLWWLGSLGHIFATSIFSQHVLLKMI